MILTVILKLSKVISEVSHTSEVQLLFETPQNPDFVHAKMLQWTATKRWQLITSE